MLLREILRIPAFERFQVVAGRRGLDRDVSTVSVMDAPDIYEWMRGGEFLITSGYVMKDDPEYITKMVEKLDEWGASAFGIKLGGKGCYVTDFEREEILPPMEGVHVVDTTGAGDSFMAGLICAVGRGWNIFDAAGFASVVAAKNIEAIGGTAGVPCFDEALRFYQSRK